MGGRRWEVLGGREGGQVGEGQRCGEGRVYKRGGLRWEVLGERSWGGLWWEVLGGSSVEGLWWEGEGGV